MRRRNLIKAIAGLTATWPFVVRAQQSPLVGFLGANTPTVQSDWTAAFVERLRELGWTDGRNLIIEYRWGEGRSERSPELLAQFVRLKADVIVTHGTENVIAAKQATSTIPVVFAAVSDPVANGIVVSLSRPGGNITGLSNEAPDLAGKRLELLREIAPGVRRVVILANANSPAAVLEAGNVETAAHVLGIETVTPEIRQGSDIEHAIAALRGQSVALYIQSDPLFNFNRVRINTLAVSAQLPTVTGFRSFVAAGGLISYGPNFPDLFRRSAEFVDKILRGAKPSDLPVEQPTKFDLAINLTTAKALGLDVSKSLIARADEVIE